MLYADFDIYYDTRQTAKVRKDWNFQELNCYVDTEGNYLITEGFSLQSLSADPYYWQYNKDTKLYFVIHTEEYSIVAK